MKPRMRLERLECDTHGVNIDIGRLPRGWMLSRRSWGENKRARLRNARPPAATLPFSDLKSASGVTQQERHLRIASQPQGRRMSASKIINLH